MQFRVAHPTWKIEWSGWRDTVLVDVCNPIVWHASALGSGRHSGTTFRRHVFAADVPLVHHRRVLLLNRLFYAPARAPNCSALCPARHGRGRCLLIGIDGRQRSGQAKPTKVWSKGEAWKEKLEMRGKAYLTRSTAGTECTGYTRLGGQESGVDSAGAEQAQCSECFAVSSPARGCEAGWGAGG
jgi:hypothetical protein